MRALTVYHSSFLKLNIIETVIYILNIIMHYLVIKWSLGYFPTKKFLEELKVLYQVSLIAIYWLPNSVKS